MFRSRITPRSTAVPAAALALAAASLAATPASAEAEAQTSASVAADWDGQMIMYVAGEGQVNDLYVTSMGPGETEGTRRIGFNDEHPIVLGEHCSYIDPSDDTFAVCELPETSELPDDIHVFLGDGDDDLFTSDPGVSTVHGGAGNDTLHAHTAYTVYGDEGDDMLMGGIVMEGGDGMDHIIGDDRDQELRGGRGDDMIEAYGGADVIYGNSGEDYVTAGKGDDFVSGGPDDDTLYGNSGDDILRGGGGTDFLSGGPGTNDVRQ